VTTKTLVVIDDDFDGTNSEELAMALKIGMLFQCLTGARWVQDWFGDLQANVDEFCLPLPSV